MPRGLSGLSYLLSQACFYVSVLGFVSLLGDFAESWWKAQFRGPFSGHHDKACAAKAKICGVGKANMRCSRDPTRFADEIATAVGNLPIS
jgi:hypothetical protein